jgi:hypothetical protein
MAQATRAEKVTESGFLDITIVDISHQDNITLVADAASTQCVTGQNEYFYWFVIGK